MGKILDYANTQDELNKAIADEARRLWLEGLDYIEAYRQAKEMFMNKNKNKNKKAIRTPTKVFQDSAMNYLNIFKTIISHIGGM